MAKEGRLADDIKTIDEELVTASKMLEWERGDIWNRGLG